MADHDKLCLTRPKARKIFNAEKEKLANNNNIVIDLTGLDVIAKSFLDEFIRAFSGFICSIHSGASSSGTRWE